MAAHLYESARRVARDSSRSKRSTVQTASPKALIFLLLVASNQGKRDFSYLSDCGVDYLLYRYVKYSSVV